jgi:hypothetical protein
MKSSFAIDNQLLEHAFFIGGLSTQNDTVRLALEEFIAKRRKEEVINMFHTVNYAPEYNYKNLRERK